MSCTVHSPTDSLVQPTCILVYIECNSAPGGSPFELSLGLRSSSRVLFPPSPLRVSCVVVCPRFCLGSPHLRPQGNCTPGSDHPDIDVFQLPLGGSGDYAHNLACLVSAPSQWQWDIRKTETGITKPPLILGLSPAQSLGVPLCMTTDLMHLAGNLSDLLISLWRGTMECGRTDDKNLWDWAIFRDEDLWTAHGQAVENARMSISGSFDRKPRNIADNQYGLQNLGVSFIYLLPHPCPPLQHSPGTLLDQLLQAHSWYPDYVSAHHQQGRSRAHLRSPLLMGS